MKKLITLCLFAAPISGSFAQTPLRLIAQSFYQRSNSGSGPLYLSDSVNYKYYGWHGSRYDPNTLEYVRMNAGYSDALHFVGDLNLDMAATNNIDSGLFLNVDYDTAYYVSAYQKYYSFRTHSNSTGPCVAELFQTWDDTTLKLQQSADYYYNGGALNRVVTYVNVPPASNWDTASIRDLIYDSSGRLVLDSSSWKMYGGWTELASTRYVYGSGKGYLTKECRMGPNSSHATPFVYSRTTHTYYSTGQLRTSTSASSSASGYPLYIGVVDSFGYSPSATGCTYHSITSFDTNGNQTVKYYMVAAHINAMGLIDSGLQYNIIDTSRPAASYSIQYDIAGNPIRRNNYTFWLPTGVVYSYEQYYYEPAVAVGVNSSQNSAAFILYPNPAGNVLNLQSSNYPAGSRCILYIRDVAGGLVQRQEFIWSASTNMINLNKDMMPGTYILDLKSAAGNILATQRFMKE